MYRLKANKSILQVLKDANPKLRKAIIQHADPQVILTLCEISHNTLYGNNKICKSMKNKLRKYKRHLRNLSSSKRSIGSKRKILVQQGGFLPHLIGSILSGVIGAYINK